MKKELREIITNLGNNPVEEPELSNILGEEDFSGVVMDIWKCKCGDLNPNDYSDEDLEAFFKELEEKVFMYNYKDGSVKVTPATKDIKPLDYFKKQEYVTLVKKLAKNEKNPEIVDEIIKKVADLLVGSVDTENMTKWEINLFKHTRSQLAFQPFKTKQGKTSKS